MRFGIEYHKAMQNYDLLRADGLNHNDALLEVVHEILLSIEDWDPDITTKAGVYKNRRSLMRSVIWYLDDHQDDAAKTHLLSNGKPAVELSFNFDLDYGPMLNGLPTNHNYILCGHLDKVVDYNDQLFVKDYKTTTIRPGDRYFAQYEPNNQMSFYSLASRVVLHDSLPIKGILIDVAYLTTNATQYFRGFTFRSNDQLDEWLHDLKSWLREAEQHAADNHWPQNDTACDKFGGCRFREVCSQSPNVRETHLKADFVRVPMEERWNPLKPR